MSRQPESRGVLQLRAAQRLKWICERRGFFTVQQASREWECDEATARSWLNAFALAGLASRRRRTLAPNNEPWKWESRYVLTKR